MKEINVRLHILFHRLIPFFALSIRSDQRKDSGCADLTIPGCSYLMLKFLAKTCIWNDNIGNLKSSKIECLPRGSTCHCNVFILVLKIYKHLMLPFKYEVCMNLITYNNHLML